MPDDEKHDPLEDAKKGFGLLFRAAKAAVEKLPTKEVEEAVISGAKELGRAVESVGRSLEKQFRKGSEPEHHETKSATGGEAPKDEKKDEPKPEAKSDDKPAGGPRIGD